MSIVSIRNALQMHLVSVTRGLPVAWENSRFTPETGVPWQKVNLLPADPENPTVGSTPLALESGIFQVKLYFPQLEGPNDAAERAELIREKFPRGLALTEGDITVVIEKKPAIAPALHEDGWYVLPVSIPYYSHIRS